MLLGRFKDRSLSVGSDLEGVYGMKEEEEERENSESHFLFFSVPLQ